MRLIRARPLSAAVRRAVRPQQVPLHLALVLCVALAIGWLVLTPARATDTVVVDAGGSVADVEDAGSGMPRSNPRVAPLLAAHPNENVVACVAGCRSRPQVVQLLPKPVKGRRGAFVPSAARMGDDVYGPPHPTSASRVPSIEDDVVCVAGCVGRRGQVLQELPDLPPPARPAPARPKRDGLPDFVP
jgi:hypothetical protein